MPVTGDFPWEQPSLFDTPSVKMARASDPDTSQMAAERASYRTGSQKSALLGIYRANYPAPLTDEEASRIAGVRQGWKRCSDLRNDGYIERCGTARASTGEMVMLCRYVP